MELWLWTCLNFRLSEVNICSVPPPFPHSKPRRISAGVWTGNAMMIYITEVWFQWQEVAHVLRWQSVTKMGSAIQRGSGLYLFALICWAKVSLEKSQNQISWCIQSRASKTWIRVLGSWSLFFLFLNLEDILRVQASLYIRLCRFGEDRCVVETGRFFLSDLGFPMSRINIVD